MLGITYDLARNSHVLHLACNKKLSMYSIDSHVLGVGRGSLHGVLDHRSGSPLST